MSATPDYYQIPAGARDIGGVFQNRPAWIFQAAKYLYRAGRKPGAPAVKDLLKAQECVRRAISQEGPADTTETIAMGHAQVLVKHTHREGEPHDEDR